MNTEKFLDTCLIQDLVDGSKLRFQFFPEDGINETAEATWDDITISGRPFPIKGYASSTATGITVTLKFFDDAGPLPTKVDLKRIIWWVRSLKAPDYRHGFVSPPHPVFFRMGEFIRMYAVVTNVGISHQGPWDYATMMPKMLEVQITLSEIGDNPYGADVTAIRAAAGSGLESAYDLEISHPVTQAESVLQQQAAKVNGSGLASSITAIWDSLTAPIIRRGT